MEHCSRGFWIDQRPKQSRRSTDKRVVILAEASDYPPHPSEDPEVIGTSAPTTVTKLNPHGLIRLPSGEIVKAVCKGGPGENFVRSHAELDPLRVVFDPNDEDADNWG